MSWLASKAPFELALAPVSKCVVLLFVQSAAQWGHQSRISAHTPRREDGILV